MLNSYNSFFFLSLNSWAVLSSLCSFNFFYSFYLYFWSNFSHSTLVSFILLFVMFISWCYGYDKEFNLIGMDNILINMGLKTSFVIFIGSEVLFFISFFWSYFHFYLSPSMDLGLSWPPVGLKSFNWWDVPLINTMILVYSSVTLSVSHFYIVKGDKIKFEKLLFFTVLLGILFTFFQAQEYMKSFFSISDGSFGSIFFLLTGFHGVHVLVGTIFLFNILSRSLNSKNSNSVVSGFEMSAWYWHFVDVVWLGLYMFVYILSN